jgi:hypothetical protein
VNTTVEVPEAELRTVLEALSAADALFGPAFAMVPSYPAACQAHAALAALLRDTGEGLPPDPVGAAEQNAIGHHETKETFRRAGFTEEQAFEITLSYVRPFAAAMAMKAVNGHG